MYRYKTIRVDEHTTRDEHRLVMEKAIGRRLTFNEVVHHKNGDGRDNALSNLEIVPRPIHSRDHMIRVVRKMGPIKHGSYRAYSHRGCRCDLCKRTQRDRMRIYRAKLKAA